MASLFDNWLRQNPESTPEDQQQALSVFNNIGNSVGDNYDLNAQSVLPQSTSSDEQPQSTNSSGGFLDNLANLFSNPAFLQSASAFGSSLAGDQGGFERGMNAYAQTMDERRQEISRTQQQKLARQQQLEDRQAEQAWNDKAAYRDSLYRQYTPDSVQQYQSTGDASVLKQQELTPWQQAQVQLGTQRIDNQRSIADQRVTEQTAARLQRLAQGNVTADSTEYAPKKDSTGVWQVPNFNSKGQFTGYKPAGPEMQKQLDAKEVSGLPSASETQMSDDIKELQDAIKAGNVDTFTGQVAGRSDTVADWNSSLRGSDAEREAYKAAQRIDGNMLTGGVANAKAMGASGINTKAEADMYFKAMPRLDKTSPQALQNSLEKIQAYTKQFNATKRGQPVSTAPANSSSSSTNFGSKYGY
ncbi:hypothetical protein ACOJDJ_000154 [Cronobacter dublinensis]